MFFLCFNIAITTFLSVCCRKNKLISLAVCTWEARNFQVLYKRGKKFAYNFTRLLLCFAQNAATCASSDSPLLGSGHPIGLPKFLVHHTHWPLSVLVFADLLLQLPHAVSTWESDHLGTLWAFLSNFKTIVYVLSFV